MIVETDASVIAEKVSASGLDTMAPFSEQVRDVFFFSLYFGTTLNLISPSLNF
jgi:hypothetical protein